MTLSEQIEALDGTGKSINGLSENRLYDGRIEFALHGRAGRLYLSLTHGGLIARNDCPHYTTSLDAAMMLVPDGWGVTLVAQPPDQKPWAAVREWQLNDEGKRVTGNHMAHFGEIKAATPALALCAAALRAKENEHGR